MLGKAFSGEGEGNASESGRPAGPELGGVMNDVFGGGTGCPM